jgi:hypothetical protein
LPLTRNGIRKSRMPSITAPLALVPSLRSIQCTDGLEDREKEFLRTARRLPLAEFTPIESDLVFQIFDADKVFTSPFNIH